MWAPQCSRIHPTCEGWIWAEWEYSWLPLLFELAGRPSDTFCRDWGFGDLWVSTNHNQGTPMWWTQIQIYVSFSIDTKLWWLFLLLEIWHPPLTKTQVSSVNSHESTIVLELCIFPFPACLLSCWQWQWQTMAMVNTGDQALQTGTHLGLLLQHQNSNDHHQHRRQWHIQSSFVITVVMMTTIV